jgi:hypothetical protein
MEAFEAGKVQKVSESSVVRLLSPIAQKSMQIGK